MDKAKKVGLPKWDAAAVREKTAVYREKTRHYILTQHPQKYLIMIFRHALLLGMSFVIIYPLLFMLSNAFKPVSQYRDPSVIWIPKSFTLDNFMDVFEAVDFIQAYINTLIYTVFPTFIQVAACIFVAYGFARFRFKGKSLMFGLVILTIIVPPQTISTSLFAEYRYFNPFGIMSLISALSGGAVEPSLNLISTPWVNIIPGALGVGLRSGLYIFIFRQFLTSMPKELEEAATVDGCGPYKTFLRIMVPNATNIMLSVLLLALVWNWNDYYNAATFIPGKYTVATALNDFQRLLTQLRTVGSGAAQNFAVITTRIQAACLLGIAPLLVLYLCLQRKFTESIESSGLTGM